jgi:haloalkane dehalogenase
MPTQVTLDSGEPLRLPSFHEAPSTRLDVGHSQLAYRRCGRGPDLVLVHGWPLHSATFRAMLPALASRFTCHLIDLPGAGFTVSRPDAPLDMESHAAALRSAIDQLDLDDYALLAHDSGGAVARLLAADDARVTRLVLGPTELPGHYPGVIAIMQTLARIPGGPALVRQSLRMRWVRQSSLCFGSALADPAHAEGEFYELFVAPLLTSSAAFRGQFHFLRNFEQALIDRMPEVHARIQAPTLLIWGDADTIFPVEKARLMTPQFAGGARFVVLPGGKTFVHEEQPEAFLRHALPFLSSSSESAHAVRAV